MSGVILKKILYLQKRVLTPTRINSQHIHKKHSIQPQYYYNMNEAYLRYEKGDETFQFTFRFTKPELNLDRQFHMVRKRIEPVAVFLRRLDSNLDKYLSAKKKRKSKKDQNAKDVEKKPDNVQNGEIAFVRNQLKIDLKEPCEILFHNTSQITLEVFGTSYKMKLNVPWILSMSLPSSMLIGFPTYPADFQTVHTDKNKSEFLWYINRSEATHASKVYKSSWEQVGKGFIYTPTALDVNCRLKLQCTPVNQEQTGPITEVESENGVQAGPGKCPFEIRHLFTGDKLSGKNFRFVSYNILADVYASTEYSRDVLFPYCPPYALAIDYRKQLIIKELVGYNSDIICLQEVDSKVFERDLFPILSLLGYDGIFNRKGDDLSEGVAIFYNEKRFKKIRSESRVMGQNVDAPGFNNIWQQINNDIVKERFVGRNTTVQVTVLRSKDNPNEILVIGNTHLYFQPDADHIRLLQGFYALAYLQEIVNQTRASIDDCSRISVILSGDFNSTPDCGIYQLMTTGHVPHYHKDWKSNSAQIIENVSLSHNDSFASACGTPQYTNFTVEFADCLDYIFYQSNNIEVTQVVPFPSKEELSLNQAIPSILFPSDHVALCADLKWMS
ncbi:2',5'-phosphodiesterase 12 [Venturia canescens]|uniref:2',5'-phosphodiesterase 12 n=1 Tax=Venturia canescens TaxID=32260 RepID=UPI001C9C21CE|nr:2',5'-phosphodiesterase 12 [Venturia canescens]